MVLHHTAPSGCFWPAKIQFFYYIFIYHNTLILRHTHLAVGNHPEIEKEKKDVCNCTRWGSNPQCFDWKSTAQTTTPYMHTRAYTCTHTHTRMNTRVHGGNSNSHGICVHSVSKKYSIIIIILLTTTFCSLDSRVGHW